MLDPKLIGGSRLRVVVGSVGSAPSISCHEPRGGRCQKTDHPRRANKLRPPANLPEPERELFASLVAACSPQHFKLSDMPLLCRYCEASTLAGQAADHLRAEGPVIAGRVNPWLTVREKEIRAMTALSMRLRLSPQSRNPTHQPAGTGKQSTPSAYEILRAAKGDDDADGY